MIRTTAFQFFLGKLILVTTLGIATPADSQTIINVNAQASLTEAHLETGSFMGQSFALGPETTFEINENGSIGPVGQDVFPSGRPFLFGGATININSGGEFESAPSFSGEPSLVALATINLQEGGVIGDGFEVFGSTELNILGGEVGSFGEANSGSTVNLMGGLLGFGFRANRRSTVNVHDGMATHIVAGSGSNVNLLGGETKSIRASDTSNVTISGGIVDDLNASQHSQVSIQGGTLKDSFRVNEGANVSIFGNEFQLNGAPFTGSSIELSHQIDSLSYFSGTLLDGSSFIFSPQENDSISSASLIRSNIPSAEEFITVPTPETSIAQKGLRQNQTLVVRNGGRTQDGFAVVGATLSFEPGSVSGQLELVQSTLNILGGRHGGVISALANTQVNVRGGEILGSFSLSMNSQLKVTGGYMEFITAKQDSVATIAGGAIGGKVTGLADSVTNISGGTIEGNVQMRTGSVLNLLVTSAAINGESISLSHYQPVEIFQRDALFQATLADGSLFEFDLDTQEPFSLDYLDPNAILRVTLVPEPKSLLIALLLLLPVLQQRRHFSCFLCLLVANPHP